MMRSFTVFTALLLPLARAAPQSCGGGTNVTIGQVVDTSSGPVAGHGAAKHPEVSEYLGIPYAQAPVGDLRFAAPLKYTGSSLHNGSVYGSSCPQLLSQPIAYTPEVVAASNITEIGVELFNTIGSPDVVISEDCLFLNIWSKPQSGEKKKAVMVYIHGGGFSGGTGSLPVFNGATLAEEEDVIIVTINYRVSILGWPGNPESQNNLAFLDQRLAVEWVRDNIANFGGDTSRITLFGQSAGGASADYYSYAFASDPIVSSTISQSGNAFAFGLPYPESTSATAWYTVTSTVGCGNASTNATELLACMRGVDVDTILKAIPTGGLYSLLSPFAPTVDDVLVFANYSQATPASVPVLIGSNDYEPGTFRTQLALAGLTFADSDWDELNLASYGCPAAQRANASVAANNPTWRYRFFGVWPNINISSEGGAYHGAELQLLFGTTFSSPNATVDEIEFETYIRGAWAAFAKDPVNGLVAYEDGWPLYNPTEKTLVRLAYENSVGANLAFPEVYDAGCDDADLAALVCRLLGAC
ncbi:carboxylesterase [Phlyctema vagabunda]|uniref:Carboxylic ester hydrolase n=1 Tax=Phlyctema vagabunda TaxID=108571 RepID=A0ABR4PL73_9HELO